MARVSAWAAPAMAPTSKATETKYFMALPSRRAAARRAAVAHGMPLPAALDAGPGQVIHGGLGIVTAVEEDGHAAARAPGGSERLFGRVQLAGNLQRSGAPRPGRPARAGGCGLRRGLAPAARHLCPGRGAAAGAGDRVLLWRLLGFGEQVRLCLCRRSICGAG